MTEQDAQVTSIFDPDPMLGRYLAHHPSNRIRLLIIGGVVYGVPVAILNLLFPGAEGITAGVLIAIFAALALAVSWWVLHLWNREVILYEQGFTYREGGRVAYFRYHEIISFKQRVSRVSYLGIVHRDIYEYTLHSSEDEVLRLTHLYNNVRELGKRLEQRVTQARHPVVEERLKRGETIDFGAHLSLTQTAILCDGASLAWDAFAGFRASGGKILINAADQTAWASVPVSEIDNLQLLIKLFKERQHTASASGEE